MTRAARSVASPPTTMDDLLSWHRPLAIRNDREYEEAARRLDELAVLGRCSPAQERMLETLALLVEAYDEQHHAITPAGSGPLDALRFLVTENELTGRDLAGSSVTRASAIASCGASAS